MDYIKRCLNLPLKVKDSFFLWGPRKVGKSTLLKQIYPQAYKINLLKSEEYRKYMKNPELLRLEHKSHKSKFIIIDEVQKVPALLDEVHYLIEEERVCFCLCGSSARKLKRGHANLLGGRALRYELSGFTYKELKSRFDLSRALNAGLIPSHYLSDQYHQLIESYVSDYLKEEILAEGLVQNLQSFSNFLDVVGLSDGQQISYTNIARESGVSAKVVRSYFQILEDTLMGQFIYPYQKNAKRRISKAPKFYFFDVGVINWLARRGEIKEGSELFGYAFENFVFHELRSQVSKIPRSIDIQFWRTSGGAEVDFILNGLNIAIEVKASKSIKTNHLKGLRSFKKSHDEINRFIVVCLCENNYITDDGIEIISYKNIADVIKP